MHLNIMTTVASSLTSLLLVTFINEVMMLRLLQVDPITSLASDETNTSLHSMNDSPDLSHSQNPVTFTNLANVSASVTGLETGQHHQDSQSSKNSSFLDWVSADDDLLIPKTQNKTSGQLPLITDGDDIPSDDRENIALEMDNTDSDKVLLEKTPTDHQQSGKSTTTISTLTSKDDVTLTNTSLDKSVGSLLNEEEDTGVVNLNVSTNATAPSFDGKVPAVGNESEEDDRNSVLDFHPVLSGNRTIRFRSGHQEDWHQYAESLAEFLEPYEKEAQERNVHCDFERVLHEDHACRFDLVYLGPSCTKQNNFGYGIGKPCVLISPAKIADWVPTAFDNVSTDVPDEVQRLMRIFNSNFMFVTCEGESESDRSNIGPMAYLPPYQGFPSYFFPYKGNTVASYVSPLMAVEFLNPSNGTLINIVCRAWAKNVLDLPRQATLKFSLQVN